jgi:hypothetical protein
MRGNAAGEVAESIDPALYERCLDNGAAFLTIEWPMYNTFLPDRERMRASRVPLTVGVRRTAPPGTRPPRRGWPREPGPSESNCPADGRPRRPLPLPCPGRAAYALSRIGPAQTFDADRARRWEALGRPTGSGRLCGVGGRARDGGGRWRPSPLPDRRPAHGSRNVSGENYRAEADATPVKGILHSEEGSSRLRLGGTIGWRSRIIRRLIELRPAPLLQQVHELDARARPIRGTCLTRRSASLAGRARRRRSDPAAFRSPARPAPRTATW